MLDSIRGQIEDLAPYRESESDEDPVKIRSVSYWLLYNVELVMGASHWPL